MADSKPRLKGRKLTDRENDGSTKRLALGMKESDSASKNVPVNDGDSQDDKSEAPGDGKPTNSQVLLQHSLVTGFEGPIKDKLDDELSLAEAWMSLDVADGQISCCFDDLTKILAEVLKRKTSGTPTKTPGKGSETEEGWKENTVRKIFDNVVNLRTFNRYQKLCLKKQRDEAQKARSVVENLQYQYQNDVAEADYIRREVRMCKNFRSLDEDMRLVSLEQFFSSAPPEVNKPGLADNPHELQLARLKFELTSRQDLSKRCEEARATRIDCVRDIKELQRSLNSLAPATEKIIDSCQGLTDVFPESRDLLESIHLERRVRCLPQPLHTIFVKLMSYQEARDARVSVAIRGDLDEAVAVRENDPWMFLAVQPPESEAESSSSESENEPVSDSSDEGEEFEELRGPEEGTPRENEILENGEQSDVEMEAEESVAQSRPSRLSSKKSRRSKKSKKRKKKAWKKRRQEAIKEKRRQACKPHPLSLIFTVLVGRQSALVLEFSYFPYFNFITVKGNLEMRDWQSTPCDHRHSSKILGIKALLRELSVTHAAEESFDYPSPNPTTAYRARRLKLSRNSYRSKFNEKTLGFPFWWAQRWGDLKFPFPRPDEDRKSVLAKVPGRLLSQNAGAETDEEEGVETNGTGVSSGEGRSKRSDDVDVDPKYAGSVHPIVKLLRKKVDARISLACQVAILEEIAGKNKSGSSKVNIPVHASVRHEFPLRDTVTVLNAWKAASKEELEHFMILGGVVNDSEEVEDLLDLEGEPVYLRYLAAFARPPAKAMVSVLLTPNFPDAPPKCYVVVEVDGVMSKRNNDAIRELEREVNYYWKAFADPKELMLLHIMQKMAVLIDVFLETRHVDQFPRHFSYSAISKGRNRAPPFVYSRFEDRFFPR